MASPRRRRRALNRGVLRRAVACLLTLTIARPAPAQPSESARPASLPPAAADAAREKFERGVELINRDNDAEAALAQFTESLRLYPTPVAALNVAVCLKELGRYASALDSYDALLLQFGAELLPAERAAIEAQRDGLIGRVGELEVRVDVPGTSVVVDGVHRGQSPLRAPLRLDVGVHMVRLSREGFQVVEQRATIAPGRRKQLVARLSPMAGVGVLYVDTDDGSVLDVLVDGAVVGQTPWHGNVSVGLHAVRLGALGRGVPPTSVRVKLQGPSVLRLHPVRVDAQATIEPEPPEAAVYVDGVFVGNGAWTGALPSGKHRLEVMAPGYALFRRELRLEPGMSRTIPAKLLVESRPKVVPATTGFFLQPLVGLAAARTLGGSVDQACDCDARSRPLGYLAELRAGYRRGRRLSLEVAAGYVHMAESSTRRLSVSGEADGARLGTEDLRERLALSGPLASVGVSVRFPRQFSLTARLAAGASLLFTEATTAGTIRSTDGQRDRSGQLIIDEPTRRLVTPFVSTELRFGRTVARWLTLDLGIALMLWSPPAVARAERRAPTSGADSRDIGVVVLPDEQLSRPFLLLVPSVGGSFEL